MADEKFLEFLHIRRPHVFQQKIRKSTFLSTALQNNRKRWSYRLLIVLSVLACTSIERRFWTLARSGQWFEIVETAFTEKEWYNNSRGLRSTFDYIVREIQDEIVRKDTPMRKAVSPRKRTAITLYHTSSTAEYRRIANLFGVSTSFVCLCTRDLCQAITKKLTNDFLSAIQSRSQSESRANLHMLSQIGADQC